MEKKELEKAVEKGESAWVVFNQYSHENDSVKEIDFTKVEGVELHNDYFQYFYGKNLCGHRYELIFKTKAEAEHYLHHANITRTEQLPFYTFSEIAKDEKSFKVGKTYTLIEDKNFVLDINKSYVSQIVLYTGKEKYSWNFNEENFYKAYDECVRLFRGGE